MRPAVQHDAVDGDWTTCRLLKSFVILNKTSILTRIHSLNAPNNHTHKKALKSVFISK